jgi:hypothetical protein
MHRIVVDLQLSNLGTVTAGLIRYLYLRVMLAHNATFTTAITHALMLHCTDCKAFQAARLSSLRRFVFSILIYHYYSDSSCEPRPHHCRRLTNRRSRHHARGTGSRALCRCQPLRPRCVECWPAHADLCWCRSTSGAENGCAGAVRLQGPEVAELGPRVHHLLHRHVINLPSPQMVRQPQACTMHPANCSQPHHSGHMKTAKPSIIAPTSCWQRFR